MLSPPYSPHSDLVDAQSGSNGPSDDILTRKGADLRIRVGNGANALSSLKQTGKSMTSSIRSTGSSSSSNSSYDEDEEEEDDTDDDNVIDSDGVGPRSRPAMSTIIKTDAKIGIVSTKRSAEEAFGKDVESVTVVEAKFTYGDDDADSENALVSLGESPESPEVHDLKVRRMTTCWDALMTNPRKYLRQERNLSDLYPLRRHSWAGPGSIGFGFDDASDSSGSSPARASSTSNTSTASSTTGARRGRKPGRQPGGGRGRRRASVGLGSTSSEYGSRFSSRQGSVAAEGTNASDSQSSSESNGSASPTSSTSTSSSGTSNSSRVHDSSYHQLEDYSPNVSTSPPGKSLRAEWKGAPMDLSGDPDLPLLHPAEAHLASVLRSPCDVYLDSKRRLFAEKVHRLRQGSPFRRTDSQKACRIDVNKASRLFGAFEKIGWLEDALFFKYLKDN